MATLKSRYRQIGIENHEKGKSFEKQFLAFMKSDLGYGNAKIRGRVKSNIDSKGTQVDIIAEKPNAFEKWFKITSLFLICIVPILFHLLASKWTLNTWSVVLIIEVVLIISILMSYKYNVKHVWVECKNQKGKVSVDQIHKMIDSCKAYKATKGKQFDFMNMYFVSASGYTDDAYNFARSQRVTCFILNKNGIFEEVTYWNI